MKSIPEGLIPEQFDFDTGRNMPLPKDGRILCYTRYQNGNLCYTEMNKIKHFIPRPINRGGQIIFKNGAIDQYHRLWPLTLFINS